MPPTPVGRIVERRAVRPEEDDMGNEGYEVWAYFVWLDGRIRGQRKDREQAWPLVEVPVAGDELSVEKVRELAGALLAGHKARGNWRVTRQRMTVTTGQDDSTGAPYEVRSWSLGSNIERVAAQGEV
jgi:hypothetical protein